MKFLRAHKKGFIITGIVLTLLLVLIILMFTVFSLKKVEIEFKVEVNVLADEEIQQEIKDKTLEYGGSVLFINKERITKDLEKEFPYIKIINIETRAPDTFIIHCTEREELYAIESNNKVIYCDEDLKILKIEEGSYTKTESNAVLLTLQARTWNEETEQLETDGSLELNLGAAEVGQFLSLASNGEELADVLANQTQTLLTTLLQSFEENNRNIAYVRANYQSFEIFYDAENAGSVTEWHTCLRIIDNIGFETQIADAQDKLAEKIEIMLTEVGSLAVESPSELLTSKLLIYVDADEILQARKIPKVIEP